MSFVITKASKRGKTNLDWLTSYHSFSFGNYYNPKSMGFGKLRVLNDDIIKPNFGFGMHPHSNMEIITIVLNGSLRHTDSLGNTGVLTPGIIQIMSAGKGILHSEVNSSKDLDLELLQIWIEPTLLNITPRYEQKEFEFSDNSHTYIVGDTDENSLRLNQRASLSILNFDLDSLYAFEPKILNSKIFIFVIQGDITTLNERLLTRDSMQVTNESILNIKFNSNSKVLIIETL